MIKLSGFNIQIKLISVNKLKMLKCLIGVVAILLVISGSVEVAKAATAIGGTDSISTSDYNSSGAEAYVMEQGPVIWVSIGDTGGYIMDSSKTGQVTKAEKYYSNVSTGSTKSSLAIISQKLDKSLARIFPATNDKSAYFRYTTSKNGSKDIKYTNTETELNRIVRTKSVDYSSWVGRENPAYYAELINMCSPENTAKTASVNLLDNDGWKKLIGKDGNSAASLEMWAYLTDVTTSGASYKSEIVTRLNKLLNPAGIDFNKEFGYDSSQISNNSEYKKAYYQLSFRYIAVLMSLYDLSKDSGAEDSYSKAINNYIDNIVSAVSGHMDFTNPNLNMANIVFSIGGVYNADTDHKLLVFNAIDMIQSTMGITPSNVLTVTDNVKGLTDFYDAKLRDMFRKSVAENPNATRTFLSANINNMFGSALVNIIAQRKPNKISTDADMKEVGNSLSLINLIKIGDQIGTSAVVVNSYDCSVNMAVNLNVSCKASWQSDSSLKLNIRNSWKDTNKNKIYNSNIAAEKNSLVVLVNNKVVDSTSLREQIKDRVQLTITNNVSSVSTLDWASAIKKTASYDVKLLVRYISRESSVGDQYAASKRSYKDFKAFSIKKMNPYISGLSIGQANEKTGIKQITLNSVSDAATLGLVSSKAGLTKFIAGEVSFPVIIDKASFAETIEKGELAKYKYSVEMQILLYNKSGELLTATNNAVSNSNKVKAKRVDKLLVPTPVVDVTPAPVPVEPIYAEVATVPSAYSELKEGTVQLNGNYAIENFEAMAGVPSTETLYFSSGGSEFILELAMQYIPEEKALRTYNYTLSGLSYIRCEFSAADTADGLELRKTINDTPQVVTGLMHLYAQASAVSTVNGNACNGITQPTFISSMGSVINNHSSASVNIPSIMQAKWEGRIVNRHTSTVDSTGNLYTAAYNGDIEKAMAYAKLVEGSRVVRTAASDGNNRRYVIGDATISVTLGNSGYYYNASAGSQPQAALPSSLGPTSAGPAVGTVRGLFTYNKPSTSYNWSASFGTGTSTTGAKMGSATWSNGTIGGSKLFENGYKYDNHNTFTRDITYTITVTFADGKVTGIVNPVTGELPNNTTITDTLATHALCGPCCNHTLTTTVGDSWSQAITYSYMRINHAKVWKITRAYVNGMQTITYDEQPTVDAGINQGDPNVYYNIGNLRNSTYAAQSNSQLGGANGYYAQGKINLSIPGISNVTTGVSAGRFKYSYEAAQGDNVSWSEYRSNQCDGGTTCGTVASSNPFKLATNRGHSNSWSKGLIYNNINNFDSSKFITGTDAVEKSTECLDANKIRARRNVNNEVTIISDMLLLQTSSGDQSASLYEQKQTQLSCNNFVYANENESTLYKSINTMWYDNAKSAANWLGCDLFDVSGTLTNRSTINVGGYNGSGAYPYSKYSTYINNGAVIETPLDSIVSRPTRNSQGLRIFTDGIKQNPINPNDDYTTGQSYVRYNKILSYSNPISNLVLERGTLEADEVQDYDFSETADFLVGGGDNELDVPSKYNYNSLLSKKVNDIIVFNPLAVTAGITNSKDASDQRTSEISSLTESLLNKADSLEVCPGSPALCEFRYVNCRYANNVNLMSFDFNDAINDSSDEQIATDFVSGYELDLNSSFTIVDSTKPSNLNSLYCRGERLEIKLDDLGVYYVASNKLQVSFDIWLPATTVYDMMLFSFAKYGIKLSSTGELRIVTANGVEWSTGTNITDRAKHNVKLVMSFYNSDSCTITVDGVLKTLTKNNSIKHEKFSVGDIGDSLNIGSNDITVTTSNFYMDNLVITKLGGQFAHDDSCYIDVFTHDEPAQYTCGAGVSTFECSDGRVEFRVTETGLYKLEAWGAQGGSDILYKGGLGGFTYGTRLLQAGDVLQIYVGGAGDSNATGSGGGYNGGGNAGPVGSSGGGGGASDIRLNSTSTSGRILVAGGGGGAGDLSAGGHGNAELPFGSRILGSSVGISPSFDSGGGGGGYFSGVYEGGISSTDKSDRGLLGGMGYTDSYTSSSGSIVGTRSGDGLVRITCINHVHNASCGTAKSITNKAIADYKLKTTAVKILNNGSLSSTGSYARMNLTGADTQFEIGCSMPESNVSSVAIRYKIVGNYSGSDVQLFYNDTNTAADIYSESRSCKVNTGVVASSWNTVVFNMAEDDNWGEAQLRKLRLDIPNNNSGNGYVLLDYVKIYGYEVDETISTEEISNNVHVHTADCITYGQDLKDAFTLAESGDLSYIKALSGDTVFNRLSTYSTLGSIYRIFDWSGWNSMVIKHSAVSTSLMTVSAVNYSTLYKGMKLVNSNVGDHVEIPLDISASAIESINLYVDYLNTSNNSLRLGFRQKGSSNYNYVRLDITPHYNDITIQTIDIPNWVGTIDSMVIYGTSSFPASIIIQELEFFGYGKSIQNIVDTVNIEDTNLDYDFKSTTSGTTKITVANTGTYLFKLAGGAGGGITDRSRTSHCGYGGYIEGITPFNKGDSFFVNVGGKGQLPAGGYNGGGNGSPGGVGAAGYGGGGASDINAGTSNTVMNNRILVAGGGGGSDDTDAVNTTSDDGTGGDGGLIGGNGKVSGVEQSGTGGTQMSGWALGVGESVRTGVMNYFQYDLTVVDVGGAGGGYYGGKVNYSYTGGGGGGSSFVDGGRFTNISSTTGLNSGDGYAIVHPKTMVRPVIKIIGNTVFGSLNGTELGRQETFEQLKGYFAEIPDKISGVCNPIFTCGRAFNQHVCNANCANVKVLSCSEPHHISANNHYEGSNPICWSACHDDSKHKKTKVAIKLSDGTTVQQATYINLDDEFTLYVSSKGDFYESEVYGVSDLSSARGIGYMYNMSTAKWVREKWVTFDFDVLYYNVNDKVWVQYLAGESIQLPVFKKEFSPSAWKSVEEFRTNEITEYRFYCTMSNNEMTAAEVIISEDAINETNSAGKNVPYVSDGKSFCNGSGSKTNGLRNASFEADASIQHDTYLDLVGRIGNLLVTDTDDMRFCNLFKQENIYAPYIVEGLIREVYSDRQNYYLSWHNNDGTFASDIRGIRVSNVTKMYNTWGTQKWTEDLLTNKGLVTGGEIAEGSSNKSLPLSGDKNNKIELSTEQLKAGYDVLFEISTMGNYSNHLQLVPYFYALDLDATSGTSVYPVDVYMDNGGTFSAINLFDATNDTTWNNVDGTSIKEKLTSYIMNLDWINESVRRNYKDTERIITDKVTSVYTDEDRTVTVRKYTAETLNIYYEELSKGRVGSVESVLNSVGEAVKYDSGVYYGSKKSASPDGIIGFSKDVGTMQLMNLDGYSRTYIGSPYTSNAKLNTNAVDLITEKLLGKTPKELFSYDGGLHYTNVDNKVGYDSGTGEVTNNLATYLSKAQKWNLKMGIPSNSVFVKCGGKDVNNNIQHVDPTSIISGVNGNYKAYEELADGNYVILMTVAIKAAGETWVLEYDQGSNNGNIVIGGRTYSFGSEIPNLVAVYSVDTNKVDVDIKGTH